MHPAVYCSLPGLMVLCITVVIIINCRKLKEDWCEKQPPRFRDYFWTVIESILEFFA